MDLFNKIFGKLEHIFFQPWLNPFATFYVNFRLCRFKDAIKMPIYIYGKACFENLKGNVLFDCAVKSGLVTFGRDLGHFSASLGKTYLFLEENTILTFKGNSAFALYTSLRLSKGCQVIIGKNVVFGDGVKIMSEKFISIGENTRVAFGSQIVDTNFHYVKDIETGVVERKNGHVIIGSNNWIGSNSKVTKGTVTQSWSVIASGSLTNKKFESENIIIAGSPGKIIAQNKCRIFDVEFESKLNKYFESNEERNEYKG